MVHEIVLTDSRGHKFATIKGWEDANVAAKAIFKRQNWSDLYYNITFNDGETISGSIDLEPESFHKPHQNEIFTWHLKTFWTNISKLTSPYLGFTMEDIEDCKKLITYLP
jgi:hypothetical protein